MMGRYFPYRMHPLTLAEVIKNFSSLTKEINLPKKYLKNNLNPYLNLVVFLILILRILPHFGIDGRKLKILSFLKKILEG